MSNITVDTEGHIFREDRDSGGQHLLGTIIKGTAYMMEMPGGPTKGKIRVAAGNPELTFTIEAYKGEPISSGVDDGPPAEEASPSAVVGRGEATPKFDLTGFPDESHPSFKTAFINHYSQCGWDKWLSLKK